MLFSAISTTLGSFLFFLSEHFVDCFFNVDDEEADISQNKSRSRIFMTTKNLPLKSSELNYFM